MKDKNPRRLVQVTTVPLSFCLLRGQAEFLKERGFVMHGISSPGEALKRYALAEDVAVHAVEMPRRITPLRDLLALWRIYRLLRKIRPHIVHAHTPKGGLLGTLAAWLARVPVRVYTIHGLPMMTARGWRRRLLLWTERISCRCASAVYSVSHSIREVAIRERICPAEKIQVLLGGSSRGVDARSHFDPAQWANARRELRRRYDIPEDALVAGFVGRIVRDKGMIELAGAWRILRLQFPSIHLLLVGTFESQDPVPAEVQKLFQSDPQIHLAGWADDAAPYYAAMDVLVLPTYREGFPGVLLEAAAMAMPVVATRVPGCVDAVVEGVTGTLVPVENTWSLADAIRSYLTEPELCRRHGDAARARVLKDFCPEAIWQALYEEYERLLAERGLATPKCTPHAPREVVECTPHAPREVVAASCPHAEREEHKGNQPSERRAA